jgi:hypothetical protein
MAEAHDARSGNGTRSPWTSTIGHFCRPSRAIHRHPRHSGTGWNADTYTQHRRGLLYIRRQSDGTPELKRSIDFTAASIDGDEHAGIEPITMVRPANPDYVSDQIWRKLHVWVHNWILQRIPEDHQHLVDGVKKGDVNPCRCLTPFWQICLKASLLLLQYQRGRYGMLGLFWTDFPRYFAGGRWSGGTLVARWRPGRASNL